MGTMIKRKVTFAEDELMPIDDDILRIISDFSELRFPTFIEHTRKWHPPVDVVEDEDRLIILVDLAGILVEDVKVKKEGNTIIIQGIRRQLLPLKNPVYHHMEIDYGEFERGIRIPRKFQNGEIKASYKDGFMKIEIKLPEHYERRIKVE